LLKISKKFKIKYLAISDHGTLSITYISKQGDFINLAEAMLDLR